MKGAIRQVASIFGLLAAFVVASHLYPELLPLLKRFMPTVPYPEVISYIVIFAVTWAIIILLSILLLRLTRIVLMGWADRLLGGALGLLKGAVAVVILVAVLTLFMPSKSHLLTDSLLAPHFQRAGYYLVQLAPKDLRENYREKYDAFLREITQKGIVREIKKKIKR
jgi:membrane protein required for colicin V production